MMGFGMEMTNMQTSFTTLHPILLFFYFSVIFFSSMILKHPVYLLFLLVGIILLNISLDKGKKLKKYWKGYVLLSSVIILLNPLFSSRGATILLYAWDRPVTLESIVYGATLSLSLLCILITFVAFNLVITPTKFLYLFGRIAPKSAFIITISLRFLPLLYRRLKEITTVQQIQGNLRKDLRKKQRLTARMEMLHTLVSWSLEEALETASSMRARGYGVQKNRSSAVLYRLESRDLYVGSYLFILAAFVCIGVVLGSISYEIYPTLPPIIITPAFLVHLTCFSLFVLIPTVMNGREWIYWYSTKSKM